MFFQFLDNFLYDAIFFDTANTFIVDIESGVMEKILYVQYVNQFNLRINVSFVKRLWRVGLMKLSTLLSKFY